MPQGQGNGQFNNQPNGNFVPQNNQQYPQAQQGYQVPQQQFQQNQGQNFTPQNNFPNPNNPQLQQFPQNNNFNLNQLQQEMANPKRKSIFSKKLLMILGGVLVIGMIITLIVVLLNGSKGTTVTPQTKTITFWTRDIDEDVVKGIIADFEAENPYIKVNFEKQSDTNYENRITTRLQLKSQNMANIVEIDESWIAQNYQSLTIVTDPTILGRFSSATLKNNTYLNVVFAVPFKFNSLCLAYNVDQISEIGYTPETFNKLDWTFLSSKVKELTKTITTPDPNTQNKTYEKITRSGIAIGSPDNVTNATEILELLLIQNDASIYNSTTKQFKLDTKFEDVMSFYSGFTTNNVWREYLGDDLKAFADGKVSMVLVKSEDIDKLQNLNPNLKFSTTIPAKIAGIQTISFSKSLAIPNYMPNQAESLKFLEFLTRTENGNKLFEGKKSQNTFIPSQTGSLNSIPKTSPFSVYSDINPNAMKFNMPYTADSNAVIKDYLKTQYDSFYEGTKGIGSFNKEFPSSTSTLQNQLNRTLKEKVNPT